jgi:hypothetical protein
LRLMDSFVADVRTDLGRSHPIAFERVGFVACRNAVLDDGVVLLPIEYLPVAEEDYLEAPEFGALISSNAIRKALQVAYSRAVSMIHVHMHLGKGVPGPSRTDTREMGKLMPDFVKVRPGLPHAALVLSTNSARGFFWYQSSSPRTLSEIQVVGTPLTSVRFN